MDRYFKVKLNLKYAPLRPHAIINNIEDGFSVGLFVVTHQFEQNYHWGVKE